jgi:ribosomal protein S25
MSQTKLNDSSKAIQARLKKAKQDREDEYKRAKQICKEADLDFANAIRHELDKIPWLSVTDLCNKLPMSRPNVYRILTENPDPEEEQ